jgi:hypothetical protein
LSQLNGLDTRTDARNFVVQNHATYSRNIYAGKL